MGKTWFFSSTLALAGFLGLGLGMGCDSASDAQADAVAQRQALLVACQLDDGTIEDDADIRACEPGNTKKTTVCHVPPGNPANAHTICVGNASVQKHLHNHDDYLGPCQREIPCPPPVTTGAGGTADGGGAATGGAGGSATGAGGSVTGAGGSGGSVPDAGGVVIL